MVLILLQLACTPPAAECGPDELDDDGVCVPVACGLGSWGKIVTGAETLFVDVDAGSGGDGSEAAPFATINAAIARAVDLGEAHVAIADGHYAENVVIDAAGRYDLEGRCAALVSVGPGYSAEAIAAQPDPEYPWALSSIHVDNENAGLGLEFITLTDAVFGLALTNGVAELDEVVVDGIDGRGLYATGDRSSLFVEDSVVRHTQGAVWTPTKSYGVLTSVGAYLQLDGVILEDNAKGLLSWLSLIDLQDVEVLRSAPQVADSDPGDPVVSYGVVLIGSRGDVSSLRVEDCVGIGIKLESGDAPLDYTLSLSDVSIQGVRAHPSEGLGLGLGVYGSEMFFEFEGLTVQDTDHYGLQLMDGARASLREVSIQDSLHGVGVLLSGSEVEIEGMEIVGVPQGGEVAGAAGLVLQRGAVVDIEDLDIHDIGGPALANLEGELLCRGCSFTDTHFASAVTLLGHLTLQDSVVGSAALDPTLGGGFGVFAELMPDNPLNALTLDNTLVEPQRLAGVYLEGAGSWQLENNTLNGSDGSARADTWPRGNAVFVTDGVTPWDTETERGLSMVGNALQDAAGGGLFLDGSSASLSDNDWVNNSPDLIMQRCGEQAAPEGIAGLESELCPEFDYRTEAPDYRLFVEDVDVEISF